MAKTLALCAANVQTPKKMVNRIREQFPLAIHILYQRANTIFALFFTNCCRCIPKVNGWPSTIAVAANIFAIRLMLSMLVHTLLQYLQAIQYELGATQFSLIYTLRIVSIVPNYLYFFTYHSKCFFVKLLDIRVLVEQI
jgi:hypothetical protein